VAEPTLPSWAQNIMTGAGFFAAACAAAWGYLKQLPKKEEPKDHLEALRDLRRSIDRLDDTSRDGNRKTDELVDIIRRLVDHLEDEARRRARLGSAEGS
jgi:hypothetical protein